MRKTLIMIVIIILLTIIGFLIFNSISFGGFRILGIKGLSEADKELDSSIQTLTRLSSTGYQEALKEVSNSAKKYNKTKEEYDEFVAVSKNNELGVNQIQKYEIEYLWTRIGTHASKENVVIKLEVEANATSSVTGCYDLKFTATGGYVNVTDFIYDIENDSTLGFKIEKLKMTPQGDSVQTTFTCSNIAINIDPSLLTKKEKTEDTDNNEENNNDSNTNSTNTNSTNTNTAGNNTNSSNTTTNTTNSTNTNSTSTNTRNTSR